MGEKTQEALKLQFDRRLRLELQRGQDHPGCRGLLACRELDGALGLTGVAMPGELFATVLERVTRLRLAPG